MTELIEQVAFGNLSAEIKDECPYADPSEGADEDEDEDCTTDDGPAAKSRQANDGGVLGKNLISGSQGKAGTVGGPCGLEKAKSDKRIDTRRERLYVKVKGTDELNDGVHGFTVAAHHLIPGEAALAKSTLLNFMAKGRTVTITVVKKNGQKVDKKKKVSKHIGYNVNGAHNGVWLPGNYYIRSRSSPRRGKSWSDLGDDPWCLHYVAAATKAAQAQFHDTHEAYSEKVLEVLNKISLVLRKHECEDCEEDTINPPFIIKVRLYNISNFLRSQLKGGPSGWKAPWLSSDRWGPVIVQGKKVNATFLKAYLASSTVQRTRGR